MERNHRQHYQRNQHALHERQRSSRMRMQNAARSGRSISQQQYQSSQRTLNERHRQTNPTSRPRRQRPNQPMPRTLPPKARRRPLKGKVKAVVVGVVLCVATVFTLIAVSPLNKVKRLVVTGYTHSNPELIKASTGIRPLDDVRNVIRQKQIIEKAIKTHSPIIDSITLKHSEWEHLEIHVNEHQVIAKINDNGQLVPILDNGNGIAGLTTIDDTQLANVPLLYNFNKQGSLHEIANSLRKIDAKLLALIESISPVQDVNKPNTIEVKMKDGNTVRAIVSTFDKRIGYYPSIVQQLNHQQGVINLEVGAYFTPYGLNTNSVKLDTN